MLYHLPNCFLSAQFAGLDLQEKPRETYRPPHLRNKPAGKYHLFVGRSFSFGALNFKAIVSLLGAYCVTVSDSSGDHRSDYHDSRDRDRDRDRDRNRGGGYRSKYMWMPLTLRRFVAANQHVTY